MRARLALLLLCLFMVGGCFRTELHTTLRADGSGTSHAEVKIPKVAMATFGVESKADFEELLGADPKTLADFSNFETYEEGDYYGLRGDRRFSNLTEFREQMTGEDSLLGDTVLINKFEFDITDRLTLRFSVEPNPDSAFAPDGDDDLVGEIVFTVTFPGPVTEHNGTLNGNTVTWNFTANEPADVHAISELGTTATSTNYRRYLPHAAAAVAVVALIGVVLIMVRSRKTPKGPVAGSPTGFVLGDAHTTPQPAFSQAPTTPGHTQPSQQQILGPGQFHKPPTPSAPLSPIQDASEQKVIDTTPLFPGAAPIAPVVGPTANRNDPHPGAHAPAVANVAPSGWYPDPEQPAQLRYFDGTQWTEHRHPMPQTGPQPPS